MTEDATRAEYERWVRAWAGPVYALARRMLRRHADAEDATQEVFLRLWTRAHLRDASRPEGPWILSVAARVVLNRARGEQRRARREAAAVAPPPANATEVSVERRERETAVQQALNELASAERMLLALHYYGGLTQAEVAQVLDAPRSTVASRLARALESLRASLARSGHGALVPVVEGVMLGTPTPAMPSGLADALLALPGASAAGVAVGLGVFGGVVVTKKAIALAALSAALLLGSGFATGRWLVQAGNSSGEAGPAGVEVSRLLEENRRLSAELARRGGPTLAVPSASPAAAPERDREPERGAGATAATAGEAGAGEGAAVDWTRFGRLLAERLDVIAAARASEGGDLAPADQMKLMEVLVELQRATMQAKALSPDPFFDDRVLPGFAVALFGDALSLSPDRRAALDAAVRRTLAERLGGRDPASIDPVERQALRRHIGADTIAAAAEGVPPASRQRYETVVSVARETFGGDRTVVSVGWDPGAPEERAATQVLDAWRDSYGFEPRQEDAVRRAAERFVRDAADVLRRRGLDRPDAQDDPAARAQADDDMLALQVSAEREIVGLLTPEQRAKARRSPPTLLVLRAGASGGRTTTMGGGL